MQLPVHRDLNHIPHQTQMSKPDRGWDASILTPVYVSGTRLLVNIFSQMCVINIDLSYQFS